MSDFYITTHTGKQFDLLEPTAEMIDIRDIAKGLSNECRYHGQGNYHYSVAQHSIYLAELAPDAIKLEALMDDAEEAYIKDLAKPFKNLLDEITNGAFSTEIVWTIKAAIANKFGLVYDEATRIKLKKLEHDLVINETEVLYSNEARQSLNPDYFSGKRIPYFQIYKILPEQIEYRFLKVFRELTHLRYNKND